MKKSNYQTFGDFLKEHRLVRVKHVTYYVKVTVKLGDLLLRDKEKVDAVRRPAST